MNDATDAEDWRQTFVQTLLPVGRVWRRAAGVAFEELGVSLAIAAPVITLQRLGDGVRHNVLADEVGVDPAAMVRSVDQLEKAGYVERRPDPEDRRAKGLYLTESGRALAERLQQAYLPFRNAMMADVTPEEAATALKVMQAIDAAARAWIETEQD